ncbi:MAG: phosphatase PAP2 family protein [Firmicutes bacterium]|nr:phosphatase PAP2 family protein [Bacillota bacterium]
MKNKLISKKIIIKSFIILIALIGFIYITFKVFNNEIMKFDIASYEFISDHLISRYVTPIALVITNMGSALALVSVALILLFVLKNKKIGVCICFNLALITIINLILKNIVERPRPSNFQIISASGYSFPSGHSMISAAFYGYLIYLIWKYFKNKKLRIILMFFLSILVFMIGISRVYLGVHYLSDVIAGFLISLAYLVVFTSIAKRYIGGKNENN